MGWLIMGLVLAAALLWLLRRQIKDRHDRETALLERVRTSALYTRIYPILEKSALCCIEQVVIRGEELRIVLYKPMNHVTRFAFEEHGLDAVDQPETLRALAHAIAVDVPVLSDRRKFYFLERSAPRDVGGRDLWFEYNVQPDYKDQMLRAWYDHREPEEGVIR